MILATAATSSPCFHIHYAHALRGPALHPDFAGWDADHYPILGRNQQLVLLGYGSGAADKSLPGLDILDSLAAPSLLRILLQLRPLAISLVGDGKECGLEPAWITSMLISSSPMLRLMAFTPMVPRLRRARRLLEPDGLAELRGHQQLLFAIGELRRDQAIALQVYGLDAALAGIAESLQRASSQCFRSWLQGL